MKMRICRLMLSTVVFGLTCLPSIAMVDNGQPTEAGCMVPIDRNCDTIPMTGECGEPCNYPGGSCGYAVLYASDTYQWGRYLQPGENVATFDNSTWDNQKNCGDVMACVCNFDENDNLVCNRTLMLITTNWQSQIHFDINELCPIGGGGTGGGGGTVGGGGVGGGE